MSFHPFVNFEERKAVILNMKLFNLRTLTKTQRFLFDFVDLCAFEAL